MMNLLKITFCIAGAALAVAPALSKTTLEVSNPTSDFRLGEVVEVDASKIIKKEGGDFHVYDFKGNPVVSQLTHDGKLLFRADVGPKGRARYYVEKGLRQAEKGDTMVYGRFFPERDDDMTWENERAAYRAYGPMQQKKGARTYGYDIWSKSVKHPVIEQRYFDHLRRNKSFHKEWGNGLDVYNVGPTLGAGTVAFTDAAGEIVYPWCWKEYEVLDNGPLRFSVRLVYNPLEFDGEKDVVETRVITLDSGDWLNKTEIEYSGLQQSHPVIGGIVVHEANPAAYAFDPASGIVAYEDPTDGSSPGAGMIYVGMLWPEASAVEYVPFAEKRGDALGHAAVKGSYRPGDRLTYYWGSGWSKGGVRNLADWQEKLTKEAARHKEPLKVKVK